MLLNVTNSHQWLCVMCNLIVYRIKPHYSGGLVATLPTDPWPSCAFVSASSYTGNTFAQHVAVNNLQTQTMEKLRTSVENSLFICRYKAVWTHVIWFKWLSLVINDSFPQSWTVWVDPHESLQYDVSGLCVFQSLQCHLWAVPCLISSACVKDLVSVSE